MEFSRRTQPNARVAASLDVVEAYQIKALPALVDERLRLIDQCQVIVNGLGDRTHEHPLWFKRQAEHLFTDEERAPGLADAAVAYAGSPSEISDLWDHPYNVKREPTVSFAPKRYLDSPKVGTDVTDAVQEKVERRLAHILAGYTVLASVEHDNRYGGPHAYYQQTSARKASFIEGVRYNHTGKLLEAAYGLGHLGQASGYEPVRYDQETYSRNAAYGHGVVPEFIDLSVWTFYAAGQRMQLDAAGYQGGFYEALINLGRNRIVPHPLLHACADLAVYASAVANEYVGILHRSDDRYAGFRSRYERALANLDAVYGSTGANVATQLLNRAFALTDGAVPTRDLNQQNLINHELASIGEAVRLLASPKNIRGADAVEPAASTFNRTMAVYYGNDDHHFGLIPDAVFRRGRWGMWHAADDDRRVYGQVAPLSGASESRLTPDNSEVLIYRRAGI